jgi:FAD/FMN-containing dehydrogenase
MVIAEADGTVEEVARLRGDLADALAEEALAVHAPETAAEIMALWRWREGVSLAVQAVRGGKVSEDIVVPLDRLGEAIAATLEIGARHGVHSCSWGHAGDGNLHSTFLVDRTNEAEVSRAVAAGEELFALAAELGGSVSGEHGIGIAKNGAPALTWSPRTVFLHEGVKALFDPKGLLNPGKKLVRTQ